MKSRNLVVSAVILLLMGCSIVLFQRCASYDTTRVTINFGSHQTGHIAPPETLIDKFLNIFISKVYAKGSPWDPNHTSVIITVTGPEIEPIQFNVPPSAASYSMILPAGDSRRITVIAYDGTERNTGGHVTLNLKGGEEVNATIRMLPIPTNIHAWSPPDELAWDYPSALPGITVIRYNIYESSTFDGDYNFTDYSTINQWSGALSGRYYKITAVYDIYGEGEPSNTYFNL